MNSSMGGLIPTNKTILRKWIADLFGSIAFSGADIVFLDAQLAELENRCTKMSKRLILRQSEIGSRLAAPN
jgi:hypothetical protein